jgi:spoIIIJ-associated protein
MKRIEADTLEEAYSKAAKALACSVTEIKYEIIQYPSVGVMGLFKKSAIIIAVKKITVNNTDEEVNKEKVIEDEPLVVETKEEIEKSSVSSETVVMEEKRSSVDNVKGLWEEKDEIIDNFFTEEGKKIEIKAGNREKSKVEKVTPSEKNKVKEESGFDLMFDDDREKPENKKISLEIEEKITKLMSVACFEIDTVEVDVFNGIAHIFVDGEDAALLIGKEGYRYNALSYMLFNWINAHYNLYIKLEIAEFIQAQEEMIDNYLKPIAEHIIEHGKGKTKPLDGILVQIALEKLRAMFPNKYIAIKTGKDGKKFIIINNFNSKKTV